MMIHQQSRSLILNLRHPETITNVIPKSRIIPFQGKNLLAIPHTLDTCKVLKNMGMDPPSPIEYQYDWTGPNHPWKHQIEIAKFLSLIQRGFVFVGMGGGKTKACLWTMDYLMSQKKVNRALVICPFSCMYEVWKRDAFETVTHRATTILYGSRAKRLELLKEPADIYVINFDGLGTIIDDLKYRDDIDLIVVDEASYVRNHSTTRHKLLYSLVKTSSHQNNAKKLWMLTATPCPQAPTDAWGLARLVGSPTAPKFFRQFKNETMYQLTQFKWVPRPEAYVRAYEIMQPAIRIAKEDCMDIPPITNQTRRCELTDEQKRAYKEMSRHYLVCDKQTGEAKITAANAAVRLVKLLQILCGAVRMDADGITLNSKLQALNQGVNFNPLKSVMLLDATHRLNLVSNCVEEAGGKVIIFAPFTAILNIIENHIGKDLNVGVVKVDGSVSLAKRTEIFKTFREDSRVSVLVAHPKCMSHGLNLSIASTVIWYAPIYSNDIYDQANNRISRPDQKQPMSIIHVAGSELELEAYRSLLTKQFGQDKILAMYKTGLGEIK